MNELLFIILGNLEKVGIGLLMFIGAYLANMGLGAWKSIKIDKGTFDWKKIGNSCVKFLVLGICIGLLTIVITIVPSFATCIGIDIGEEALTAFDSLVIVGAFLTATIHYLTDALNKIKDIFKA